MDYRFMDDLLNCSDEELQEITNRITEQLNARKALKKKKAFNDFMDALGVMARDYPNELFDIESNGEYTTMDWEELYRNFLEW